MDMIVNVLRTTAILTAISAALAIIISIAERYLNNYGECKLDINEGSRELVVDGGSNLLSTLASQKIFIPSACGGKATCGLCKLQVIEGAGPLLPTEEPYLTEKERNENYRLACQIKVKTNMKLLIPEDLFNIKEYVTTVESIKDLTHDIKEVRMRLPEGEEVNFKAGQFMQFYTKPYGKVNEEVFRAYSISSPPQDKNHIELCIRQVPEGICSTFVHTALKEGDTQILSGPYGDFWYRGNCDTMVMVAAGSGLAPMRALIYDNLNKNVDVNMVFYFGARSEEDLYYVEEFTKLAEEHENFTYIPTLSRPKGEWNGEKGRVTELLERDFEDKVGALNKEAYLCGSPAFLKSVNEVLEKKGFDKETQIYYDEF